MARTVACLVDVYETLLHYDFAGHTRKLAAIAGTDVKSWERAQLSLIPEFDSGRLTMHEAITRILAECGLAPSEDLIAELAAADVEYLTTGCSLYDDAVPFLQRVRDMGIKIALVSNCGADTRPLLDRLMVFPLTDEAILSCEVGHAKPSPEIYSHALDALGVEPGARSSSTISRRTARAPSPWASARSRSPGPGSRRTPATSR